jgi:Na+/melibiose symporter-like transporter
MEQAAIPEQIRPRTRWLYGFGAIAFGAKDNGFSYFLMFYYNQVLGLPGSLAGIAIFIAMMIDAACDPLLGYWSDTIHGRESGAGIRSCTAPRCRSRSCIS